MTINSVKVGPFIYQVIKMSAIRGDDDQLLAGDCKITDLTIQINSDYHPDVQLVTLWHEIIHTVLDAAGYSEHDEQMLEILSHGLVAVFRDNPELVESSINGTSDTLPHHQTK